MEQDAGTRGAEIDLSDQNEGKELFMSNVKKELIDMLNQALKLEHAARIQYMTHAQIISGQGAEKLIERIEEIASDEKKHEEKFRDLIAGYLGGVPTMDINERHPAENLPQILDVNLKDEKTAIDFYKKIYKKVTESKEQLPYEFERLEHEIRHVILDEEEHVSELGLLKG